MLAGRSAICFLLDGAVNFVRVNVAVQVGPIQPPHRPGGILHNGQFSVLNQLTDFPRTYAQIFPGLLHRETARDDNGRLQKLLFLF